MSSFLYRLGRGAARARRWVVLAWVIVLALAGTGALVLMGSTDDQFTVPGSESQDTLDELGRIFPQVSGTSAQIVAVEPDGAEIDTDANRRAVADAVDTLGSLDQVAQAVDPFSDDVNGAVSEDGSAAIIAVQLTEGLGGVTDDTKTEIQEVGDQLESELGGGAEVYVGGDAFSDKVPRLSPTEGVGLVIAFVVLLLVFGSVLPALMPLITAVLGVGISAAIIYAATGFASINSTAPMLAVMIGLAVGIDYALFLLSRHRDQLADGMDVEESIARATATAGSAVIFAGMTVFIALLGLAVARIPFLTIMGVAAAGGVLVAVSVAVTLIPALMAFADERLRPKRRTTWPGSIAHRRREADPSREATEGRKRFSRAWIRLVTRRPAVTVIIGCAALLVCALPATSLTLALPDSGSDEPGSASRETYDVVSDHFGVGYNGPLIVTVDIIESTDPIGLTDDVADYLEGVDGVETVALATPDPKGQIGIIQLIPTTGPSDSRTGDLVHRIRDLKSDIKQEYGADVNVTGFTAVGIDTSSKLGSALIPFGLLVVGVSLILLAMVFRSIWVPVTAAAGYVLSVLAAFGATSFVFEQGHLADVLGVTRTGSVISFLPIILMGVLFGLAMDYEVFLVSRIREDYSRKGDARGAIEHGFMAASRVVVAAALIMFGVFAAFIPEGNAIIKPIAFALAVGVFADAFIVRMTIIPAVLALLGERAWHLPAAVDRHLPVFDAEGDGLVHELRLKDWPEAGSTEAISARDLHVVDDRGETVLEPVSLHVPADGVLVVSGSGAAGKSALLYALSARVPSVKGDLKLLGRVVPQHARAVRARIHLARCGDDPDPAVAVRRAVARGARLVVLDDADLVVRPEARCALRDDLASLRAPDGSPVAYVLACQSPDALADVLPETAQFLDLSPIPLEVH